MKYSELLNQLVLDRRTMEEIGRVETLWMHPPAHRVLGFICKAGLLGNQKSAFNLSQISVLGESGILTYGSPDSTTAERVRQLESLISQEIWSEGGDRLGKIIDCLFELDSGRITHYLYVSSGWAGIVGEIYQLPTSTILSFGKKASVGVRCGCGSPQSLPGRNSAKADEGERYPRAGNNAGMASADASCRRFGRTSQRSTAKLERASQRPDAANSRSRQKPKLKR